MKLRTDDDIYRARLVYLGPPGYTLPVQLPYAQYVLFALFTVGFLAGGWLLTGNWESAGFGVAAALIATHFTWRHVDPDLPARKVLKIALTDWRSVGPKQERPTRLSARHIQFTDHRTGVRR